MASKSKPFEKIITVERHSKAKTGIYAAGVWFNFGKQSGLTAEDAPIGQSFVIKGNESEYNGKPSFFIESVAPHGAVPAIAPGVAAPSSVQAKSEKAPGASSYGDKRDASIVTQALMKSLIESPALPMFLGGARSLEQVIEEEGRKLLAVHDKLSSERSK